MPKLAKKSYYKLAKIYITLVYQKVIIIQIKKNVEYK